MSRHVIELEIRGEVHASDIPALEQRLRRNRFTRLDTTRRTSVMSFGTVIGQGHHGGTHAKERVDIRSRITNGHAEIVTKIGKADAHNRREIGHDADLEDMISFAQMFAAMGFFTKVGSRNTVNYTRKKITISIVTSVSGLAYVEIEKMSDPEHEERDHAELRQLSKTLEIPIWPTHKAFVGFCDKIMKQDDWMFSGSTQDAKRLRAEIRKIGSDRA